ncbi:MAG: UbiA family prenyltransferase [Candidatus Heimdallarchaeaceae archaeon]
MYSRKGIILSYITILRLLNGIVAGLAATCALVLSFPPVVDPATIVLLIVTTTLVSSHAMILNDVADEEEDKINAPHRPIPSRKISKKTAINYAIFVGILALIGAIAIDVINGLPGLSTAFAVFFGASLDLYDFKFKKLGFVGNAVIGANVIALFIYGSLHTYLVYGEQFNWIPICIGIGAGMGNIGREVIKGLPDIEGDRKAGNKTLAVRFGARKAAIIAAILLCFLITGGTIAIIYSNLYLATEIIAWVVIGVAVILAAGIIASQHPKWAYIVKEILLIEFLVYLLVFIVDAIIKIAA